MVNFVLTFISYQVYFAALPDSTDLQKALFVMIFAPVVTEVALTIGRFVTRAIPKRHEAASWVLNGGKPVRLRTQATHSKRIGSPGKPCGRHVLRHPRDEDVQVRMIITLIQSPSLFLLASSMELPNNLRNEERDRFLYRSHSRFSGRSHTWEESSIHVLMYTTRPAPLATGRSGCASCMLRRRSRSFAPSWRRLSF
jgi:hypothetical protein